jgi:hypothetical protein
MRYSYISWDGLKVYTDHVVKNKKGEGRLVVERCYSREAG